MRIKNLIFTVGALALTGVAQAGPISDTSLDGDHNALQCLFNGEGYADSCAGAGSGWLTGGSALDPNAEYVESAAWALGGGESSMTRIVIEIAGNASQNTFGIYSLSDPSTTLEVFGGSETAGALTNILYLGGGVFQNTGSGDTADLGGTSFGFYLSGPGGTFYSDSALNPNGDTQMVAFEGDDTRTTDFFGTGANNRWFSNDWILAWEDLVYANSDQDFNDMVLFVNSIRPVPAPGPLALIGVGLLGLAMVRRRRARQA